MNLGSFLNEYKEPLGAVGAVLAAALTALTAYFNRRKEVVHRVEGGPPPAVAEVAPAVAGLLAAVARMADEEARQEEAPPALLAQLVVPVLPPAPVDREARLAELRAMARALEANDHPLLEGPGAEVRRLEALVSERSAAWRASMPSLPTAEMNAIRRALDRDPDGDPATIAPGPATAIRAWTELLRANRELADARARRDRARDAHLADCRAEIARLER